MVYPIFDKYTLDPGSDSLYIKDAIGIPNVK